MMEFFPEGDLNGGKTSLGHTYMDVRHLNTAVRIPSGQFLNRGSVRGVVGSPDSLCAQHKVHAKGRQGTVMSRQIAM